MGASRYTCPSTRPQTSPNVLQRGTDSRRSASTSAGTVIEQAFTTGGADSDRYRVNGVVLGIGITGNTHCPTAPTLGIYTEGASEDRASSTQVGGNLTAPGSIASPGDNIYTTAAGNTITLNGATEYVLRIVGNNCRIGVTSSNHQTGPDGWAIEDRYHLSAGGFSSDSVRFAINATTTRLAASNVTRTGATLTLHDYTGSWSYKQTAPSAGTCTTRTASESTATLSSLSASTTYTYVAYSDSACTAAKEISSLTFDTLQGPTPAGVSNLTESGTRSGSTNSLATAFTTGGSTSDRFKLTNVVVNLENTTSNELEARVGIYLPQNGFPATLVGSIFRTTVAASHDGQVTITPASSNEIILNGGSTYFVRRFPDAGLSTRRTTNNGETGTGGWSIADNGFHQPPGSSWTADGLYSLDFAVNTTQITHNVSNVHETPTVLQITSSNVRRAGIHHRRRTLPTATRSTAWSSASASPRTRHARTRRRWASTPKAPPARTGRAPRRSAAT